MDYESDHHNINNLRDNRSDLLDKQEGGEVMASLDIGKPEMLEWIKKNFKLLC